MKGIAVILYERTQSGYDTLHNPIWTEVPVQVDNVLIGQPSTDDITSSIDLYGKRIEYVLGLPKGDAHVWTDAKVEFFGQTFRTFGEVIQGIEENIPTPWHKKVRVERFG